MNVDIWIGMRYLKSRKRASFFSVITVISILGVTLGVATLSVVLSVMNGFQEELIQKAVGAHAHGILFRYGLRFDDHEQVRKRLLNIEGVRSAAALVLGEVMVSAGRKRVGVGLKGVDLRIEEHLEMLTKVGRGKHKKRRLQRLQPPTPDA
ncbi:MAG: hypothetical protein AAGJ35_08270, partial [Myxococcota bacterium]